MKNYQKNRLTHILLVCICLQIQVSAYSVHRPNACIVVDQGENPTPTEIPAGPPPPPSATPAAVPEAKPEQINPVTPKSESEKFGDEAPSIGTNSDKQKETPPLVKTENPRGNKKAEKPPNNSKLVHKFTKKDVTLVGPAADLALKDSLNQASNLDTKAGDNTTSLTKVDSPGVNAAGVTTDNISQDTSGKNHSHRKRHGSVIPTKSDLELWLVIAILIGIIGLVGVGVYMSDLIPHMMNKQKLKKIADLAPESWNPLDPEGNSSRTHGDQYNQQVPTTAVVPPAATLAPVVNVPPSSRQTPVDLISKPPHTPLQPTVNAKWILAGASVIGKSHIQNGLPCQDSHSLFDLSGGWGVAVACDGAGSAAKSDVGSSFIAKEANHIFMHLIERKEWQLHNRLPSDSEWNGSATEALQALRFSLGKFADSNGIVLQDLASTIIVVVFSPFGFLTCHIGDGRAGYCDSNGNWHELITPWKGEEANQTVFITSAIWNTGETANFIECRVVPCAPTAFVLMSDGCETHSFETGTFDDVNKRYIEQNRPSSVFFDPLLEQFRKMHDTGMSSAEITDNWAQFLTAGTPGLAGEPDDKTMLIGIRMLN